MQDSKFFVFWEITTLTLSIYLLFIIFADFATHHLIIHRLFGAFRVIFSIVFFQLIIDVMIYGFVVSYQIDEESHTIYIRDSVKIYLKRRFLIDFIAIAAIIYADWNKEDLVDQTAREAALETIRGSR